MIKTLGLRTRVPWQKIGTNQPEFYCVVKYILLIWLYRRRKSTSGPNPHFGDDKTEPLLTPKKVISFPRSKEEQPNPWHLGQGPLLPPVLSKQSAMFPRTQAFNSPQGPWGCQIVDFTIYGTVSMKMKKKESIKETKWLGTFKANSSRNSTWAIILQITLPHRLKVAASEVGFRPSCVLLYLVGSRRTG